MVEKFEFIETRRLPTVFYYQMWEALKMRCPQWRPVMEQIEKEMEDRQAIKNQEE
jgi:hypothetical protein